MLTKAKGNMYDWVTHTHEFIGGECPHKCSYCYMDNPRFGRHPKYTGPIRLLEEEFSVNYGSGKTIFVGNRNDMFSDAVPSEWILRILEHCRKFENKYVFQTKNPKRYFDFRYFFPKHTILGTTIETNHDISEISKAPRPFDRGKEIFLFSRYIHRNDIRRFITVEPIIDFSVNKFAALLLTSDVDFINIGADSKGNRLIEPHPDNIRKLLKILRENHPDIRIKPNLCRLVPEERKDGE
jgi:DNA repair photolyase